MKSIKIDIGTERKEQSFDLEICVMCGKGRCQGECQDDRDEYDDRQY